MVRGQTIIFFLIAITLLMGPSVPFSILGGNWNIMHATEATSLVNSNNTNTTRGASNSLRGTANSDGFHILPDATPPTISDGSLRAEKVISGLHTPTSMEFLDSDDVIILEKDGAVRLVSNGVLQPNPILNVVVRNESERGLLGIAIANVTGSTTTKAVFIYCTQPDGEGAKNRIYRYEWDGSGTLKNPRLLLDLPGVPGPNHDGGKMELGPDGMLYAVKGDLNRRGMLQNNKAGSPPDDTSVLLRVKPLDGSPANGNPFLNTSGINSSYPNLSKYYAYGIRNSFGFDFDPLTGTIWDVEDGPTAYDEMNVVKPGFNSGWSRIMGPAARDFIHGKSTNDLVQFPGSYYADPVFSWRESVGITDMEFLGSTKLGGKYAYNIFVGDVNNGNLYFFKVNSDRTGLDLGSSPGLQDLVGDSPEELKAVTLGTGFNQGITDIETGPDGYLYVLTFGGDLYRIVPATTATATATPTTPTATAES